MGEGFYNPINTYTGSRAPTTLRFPVKGRREALCHQSKHVCTHRAAGALYDHLKKNLSLNTIYSMKTDLQSISRVFRFSPVILLEGKKTPLPREESCRPRLIQMPAAGGLGNRLGWGSAPPPAETPTIQAKAVPKPQCQGHGKSGSLRDCQSAGDQSTQQLYRMGDLDGVSVKRRKARPESVTSTR